MLWYKNWLETRFRFFMALGMLIFFSVADTGVLWHISSSNKQFLLGLQALYCLIVPLNLAGVGVATQSSFRPERGLHGSTLFTLSLPISRLRLFAVRSGLGIMELFVCIAGVYAAAWTAFPVLRAQWHLQDSLEYLLTVLVCLCAFYFLFVVFAALLADDLLRNWICIGTILLLRWFLPAVHVSASLNIFQAMGNASPLFTHRLPWASMGVSIAASAIFFWVALKIVQTREY